MKKDLDHDEAGGFELQQRAKLAAQGVHNRKPASRTQTAKAWMTKPNMSNLSSPYDANDTPPEIINTMASKRLFGSCIRKAKEMRQIATGVNA